MTVMLTTGAGRVTRLRSYLPPSALRFHFWRSSGCPLTGISLTAGPRRNNWISSGPLQLIHCHPGSVPSEFGTSMMGVLTWWLGPPASQKLRDQPPLLEKAKLIQTVRTGAHAASTAEFSSPPFTGLPRAGIGAHAPASPFPCGADNRSAGSTALVSAG